MGKQKTLAASARRKSPRIRARRAIDDRFQRLIGLSRGFYWESDAAHRFTFVVHGPTYVSTQAPDSQIGKTRWEIPSTRPDAAGWDAHKAALDAHLAFRDFGFARVGPDGAERQFVVSGDPVFDAEGRFTGYCGIGDDVTERKRAEEALRMAEERYRTLVELSPDGIVLHEMGIIQYANASAARLFGADSPDALLGRSLYDLIDPAFRDAARQRAIALLQQGVEAVPFVERKYLRLDGTAITVEVAGVAIRRGGKAVVQTVLRDVTARQRAEQLLALEHTVGRRLADADNAAEALKAVIRAVCETENWEFGRYFRVDEKAGVTRFVESWCVPGEANQEFIEKSREIAYGPGVGLTGQVWQSGQALWVSDIHRDTRATRAVFTLESGIHGAFLFPVKSEGETIGVLAFNSRQIREPDERLLQAAGVIGIQIGQFLQRKQAEESLRRFRAAIDVSADLVMLVDPVRLRYVDVNDAACRALGYGREELLAMGPHDVFSISREDVASLYSRLIAGDLSETGMEGWYRRKDGSRLVVETFRRAVPSDGGYVIVAVSRDIGRRKRAERLLVLEHTVARGLADADNASEALKAVIRAVCETENWAFGRYFRVDEEAGVLRFGEFWSVPGGGVEQFTAGLGGVVFKPGVGLAGRVWQTGQPLWIADINRDDRAIQAGFVPESGIRGAFVFPVKSEGKTMGVMAFNSREIREPDERLLQAAGVIGIQIGQFLQRKQAEEALRESEARFRSLTEMSSDWYWEQDRELRLSFHSSSFARRSGTTSDKLLGKRRWEEPNRIPLSCTWDEHRATLEAHQPFRNFEYVRIGDDGAQYFVSLSGVPIFDAAGNFNGYRGVGTNITDLVQARERVSQLAYTDPLTGLANRTSFGPALEHAVQLARRHDRKLAIMFLDLDGFKQINDAHGHDTGDRLLIEVASRLRACLRSSDLVARLGGDEFVVVLEDMQDADQVEAVACKIVGEIARPYLLVAGEESCVSASLGISMLPDDAGEPRTLMKHADTAMYHAKQCGKNNYRFFAGESADSTTQDTGA